MSNRQLLRVTIGTNVSNRQLRRVTIGKIVSNRLLLRVIIGTNSVIVYLTQFFQ